MQRQGDIRVQLTNTCICTHVGHKLQPHTPCTHFHTTAML